MRTSDTCVDYRRAIENAKSRKLKEIILDRAVQDKNIDLDDLVKLERFAFPEDA